MNDLHMQAGAWKEGRTGAASLCYLHPDPAQLEWVARHHAAVGIRASLLPAGLCPSLPVLAERKWDLLSETNPAVSLEALSELDGRPARGLFAPERDPSAPAGFLFTLSPAEGLVPGPSPDLSSPLPSLPALPDADQLMERIETIVRAGQWAVFRFTPAALDALGPAGHESLLRRLGDHHARIWCAPVRDIALWRPC